jgi:hypothetical protein
MSETLDEPHFNRVLRAAYEAGDLTLAALADAGGTAETRFGTPKGLGSEASWSRFFGSNRQLTLDEIRGLHAALGDNGRTRLFAASGGAIVIDEPTMTDGVDACIAGHMATLSKLLRERAAGATTKRQRRIGRQLSDSLAELIVAIRQEGDDA